jgi:dihydroorotate dehydrogenase
VRASRYSGVLGVNIGKNFDTPMERALDDYVHCLRAVHDIASYVAINISSPNTQNLRALQQGVALENLLAGVTRERELLTKTHRRRVPLALKIAPDLDEVDVLHVADAACRFDIDAIIATNTTLSRLGIEHLPHANEAGGLSGAPLQARSTRIVRLLADSLAGRLPIIAVGGIMSSADALDKIAAGATLIQLYTGLVYRGPALVSECARALAGAPESAHAS